MLVDICRKLETVHHQGDFECSVRYALITVDESVVPRQEEPKSGCFRGNRRVQLPPVECLVRKRDSGFERAEISDAFCSPDCSRMRE